ncbi:MAG: addiction module protein, partial [Gemmatimonadaceae bacterium]
DIEHPPFYGAGLAPDITLKPASGSATISSMKAEAIRREALSLTARERAELAEQLLASLDTLSEDEVAQLWLHEAARRAEELDRGLSKRISADDVRREAQALLR